MWLPEKTSRWLGKENNQNKQQQITKAHNEYILEARTASEVPNYSMSPNPLDGAHKPTRSHPMCVIECGFVHYHNSLPPQRKKMLHEILITCYKRPMRMRGVRMLWM